MGNTQVRVLLLIGFLIVLIGCAGHKSPWEEAQTANTIEAYEEFLAEYPHGEFADKAREKIRELRFRRVLAENTIEAYEDFILIYMEGELVDSVRSHLEQVCYLRAISEDNTTMYRKYLRCFPHGAKACEVRKRVEKLDLEYALSVNTVEVYEEFLRRYPNSASTEEIKSHLQSHYVKIEKRLLVPWTTFSDCVLALRRKLSNKLRLTVSRAEGELPRYIISPLDREGYITIDPGQKADPAITALTGLFDGYHPDDQFFAVLGIGTYLKMDTDAWVEICGVTFKSGAVKIVDRGLEFQPGTVFRDIGIRPVHDTRLGVVPNE